MKGDAPAANDLTLNVLKQCALESTPEDVSRWQDLTEPMLVMVLNHIGWVRATSAAFRVTCTRWCELHDAYVPKLIPTRLWGRADQDHHGAHFIL